MLYLLTGKAAEVPEYEFGTFSHKLLEERTGLRPGRDRQEVTRLLSTFNEQGRRLQSQMERLEAGSPATGRQKNGDRRRPRPARRRRGR
jgi:hypothetical protein